MRGALRDDVAEVLTGRTMDRGGKEIARGFLKVGATAFGGPAIIGLMQAEFQERRQWVSRRAGLVRDRLCALPGARAALCATLWGRP